MKRPFSFSPRLIARAKPRSTGINMILGMLLVLVEGATHSVEAQSLKIFADPSNACELLQDQGFAPAAWSATAYGYECSSTNLRIDYTVSGDEATHAKRIKLTLDLNYSSGDIATRKAEFAALSEILLRRLGLRLSKQLDAAIQGSKQFRENRAGARITFDPGRTPFLRQTLTLRDSTVRVVTIPRALNKLTNAGTPRRRQSSHQ